MPVALTLSSVDVTPQVLSHSAQIRLRVGVELHVHDVAHARVDDGDAVEGAVGC